MNKNEKINKNLTEQITNIINQNSEQSNTQNILPDSSPPPPPTPVNKATIDIKQYPLNLSEISNSTPSNTPPHTSLPETPNILNNSIRILHLNDSNNSPPPNKSVPPRPRGPQLIKALSSSIQIKQVTAPLDKKFNLGAPPPRSLPIVQIIPPSNNIISSSPLKNEIKINDVKSKYSDEEIKDAFNIFDIDNNNYISIEEIKHVLINIGEQFTDEEVDEMIKMADGDGDNLINFDEFDAVIKGKTLPSPVSSDGISTPGYKKVEPEESPAIIKMRRARRRILQEFTQNKNIRSDTVKKAFRRYQLKKKILLKYGDFCDVLQLNPDPSVEKVFSMFDKSKNGEVDIKEFLISLSNFTGSSQEEVLRLSFLIYDEDGSGAISKDNLIKILKANYLAASETEIKRKADIIMIEGDKNGYGLIKFDDFIEVSKKHLDILFPISITLPDNLNNN